MSADPSSERHELIRRLSEAGRQMGRATIFFHQGVAEQAGLHGTDHKYLDLLLQEDGMTAGRLAELSGLSTGAVTGVIDRLTEAGLVRRERDPSDRRKVIVVLNEDEARERLAPIFEEMVSELKKVHSTYDDNELRLIAGYLERCTEFFQEQAAKLDTGDT